MPNRTEAPEIVAIPRWFRFAATLALLWNLLGVMAFIDQMMMTSATLAELPQSQQDLYASVPWWATAAFAVAVFTGTLGSLALLMKKPICYKLFVLSFVSVVVQMFHLFFISNSYEVYGPAGTIMPIMVLFIALVLVRFAAKANNNHWFSES
ncbi:hypothetical protein [Colwellia sp. M166]|uniref:hypothetical protein n=1 Tax=Colwellia sp. M166 TaxID=2583805 RepID=UPI00211DC80F|nr:hypothetical protein [Colwellia sp. M166]|tara:strand:- start:263 stop:718 length:456 start_codon:yes stop_codon:yes gene_type:complete